jgi:hypothetical protein
MAINFSREMESTDIVARITSDVFQHCSVDQYVDEMSKATREFVQTDPEVRIIINKMVRVAFKQVDLLKLITETIRQSLPVNEVKPAQPEQEKRTIHGAEVFHDDGGEGDQA